MYNADMDGQSQPAQDKLKSAWTRFTNRLSDIRSRSQQLMTQTEERKREREMQRIRKDITQNG